MNMWNAHEISLLDFIGTKTGKFLLMGAVGLLFGLYLWFVVESLPKEVIIKWMQKPIAELKIGEVFMFYVVTRLLTKK